MGVSDANRDIEVRVPDGRSRVAFGSLGRISEYADVSRSVIVTDPLVRRYVPFDFPPDRVVEVPRGESAKNLECAETVYRRFLELEVGRDWTVLGVGGGSVSDLAGFTASTWLRGVDFAFAPTTILSMVDASVGGKNGVDFCGLKNLIGTFRLPRFVLIDLAVLGSLPPSDAASGLVEAVKHGVIEGEEHFALLERAIPPLKAGEPFRMPQSPRDLEAVVRKSVELKARVVSSDFREAGERRKLNLGHTVGHAVEAVTGLPHGACVAVGTACALRLAVRRGGSEKDAERTLELLGRLGMPTSLEDVRSATGMDSAGFREAVARSLSADKKRVGGIILFALPLAIGSVDIVPIAQTEIEDFVREAP